MADADAFARSYLFVDVAGPADGGHVADLLEAAAALGDHGAVTVQHLVFDTTDDHTTDDHAAAALLAVYDDRIERRRRHRDPS